LSFSLIPVYAAGTYTVPVVSRVLSVRVVDELAEWVDGYAEGRGMRRAAVVESALRAFRDLATGGVPELAQTPRAGKRAPVVPEQVAASARASGVPAVVAESERVVECGRCRSRRVVTAMLGRHAGWRCMNCGERWKR
jgi:transcription elongation factor Elf1